MSNLCSSSLDGIQAQQCTEESLVAQTEASISGLENKAEYDQEVEKQIQMIAKS